ncbi:transcriptional regulator FixK [Parvularcula bermudensis HTCC2503]|uniref:Transcriptional regulator FixK n=1 Tax=Parvularcula bermudensis (strain ATCC BAA-594 / HTCC2503 / KCTC 12087) TaxID=314260 RepID=E0TFD7_PARBH|nr:Crp/Fnr family transcriptional regulator [Parvularcula bermudensis]ADM09538.1 transcriptional regulator FixK [Parvularcula bermudensis HTCC2503]
MRALDVKTLKRGQTLYVAGEEATALMKVCAGAVILSVILEDGRRQIVDLVGPGDLVHFEVEGPLDHFAEALTDTEIAQIDGASALQDPDFRAYYLEQARARMVMDRRHITMLGRKSAQERLADFLECLAECLDCGPSAIDLPMTRQQIADYLGLTLETVSRIFARWGREGRLRQVSHDRYLLSDPSGGRGEPSVPLSRLLTA